MAAYGRVYGFGHLRADCRRPGSALEPYARFEYRTTLPLRTELLLCRLMCPCIIDDTEGNVRVLAWQVEPSNPLGERSKVLGPVEQERPYVLDDLSGVRLEKYALSPPNANNSQVLVWRPRNGDPKVVVPPVQTTIDVNRYLAATRDHYSKLRRQLHANTSYAAAKSSKSHR